MFTGVNMMFRRFKHVCLVPVTIMFRGIKYACLDVFLAMNDGEVSLNMPKNFY